MTYGTQKRIGELWVEDFSRRGWVDGRAVRIPGVLARPPARTGQLSAFLSDLIRELAAGRDFTCPTSPEATTWASSLPCVVEHLLHAASFDVAASEGHRVLTLPTLRFAMSELVQAVGHVYGTPATDLVRWAPDARIETLFGRFPPLTTPRAHRRRCSARIAAWTCWCGKRWRWAERASDAALLTAYRMDREGAHLVLGRVCGGEVLRWDGICAVWACVCG